MRLLLIPAILLCLAACAAPQVVVRKEIVTVDKPVPYCPAPPAVPVYPFLVDTLTDADIKDPGKVGQYYKHDMDLLRKTDDLYKLILLQYKTTAGSFAGVQVEIDKMFNEINDAESARVEALKTK